MDRNTNIKSLVCDRDWCTIFSPDGWRAVLEATPVPDREGCLKGYLYTTTWEAVQAAAAAGCNWCRLIRGGTRGEVEVLAACDEASDCTPAGDKRLKITVNGLSRTRSFSFQSFLMYTAAGDPAAKHIAARERITDVATPESFRLAQACMDKCVQSHSDCPKPNLATLLPDRVIDCSNVDRPLITLTNGILRGTYITLSYVWGGKQPMTTTCNIAEYTTLGIDASALPQTVRDAISVTHSLGQRYLWIDALCILQDSDQDKARQLGDMGRIYRDSYLTINAACAANTWEGFLHKPRPQRVPTARLPYRSADDPAVVGTINVAHVSETDSGDASRTYWDEMEPISHRGWTLQERLLPPRSLIYASDTLKYHCQTEVVSIGGALCEPTTAMRLPKAFLPQPDPAATGSGPGTRVLSAEERKTARQAWLSVVFVYTLRSISFESDKLPAVGGVAEQFAKVTGHAYLAGLWRESLLFDLLWSVEDDDGTTADKRRPQTYRAPSWSWASVNGLISAAFLEETALAVGVELKQAEVVNCWVKPAAKNVPFGEVTDGVLRLRGCRREVEFAA
ncbi:hypothetical protein AB1N83_011759 [Pleurotus pulmonarius]|nr:hypothetical protein EYR38_006292 [Pleurotus pulmonarius]